MPAHHVVLSLSIQGSPFFGDITFDFTDGLVTLMGGRGSGKTSVLHLLRFAVGSSIPESYAKDFDAHIKFALGPGTATARVKTRHGVVYTSSRAYGEEAKVRNEAGELVDVSLDGELFRLDGFAAKEIEELARNPVEQLRLLDRLAPPEEMRRIHQALDEVQRRLLVSGAGIDRLSAEIALDEERDAQRPALLEALKGLSLSERDAGGELTRAEARRPARGREQAAMKGLSAEVANVQRAFELFARESQRRLAAAALADLERADDPVGPIFQRAHDAIRQVAGALEVAAGRLGTDFSRASEVLGAESRSLVAIHDKEDETYKSLVVRADSDKDRALQREALHRQRDALDVVAQRMALRQSERERAEAAHAALFDERTALVLERNHLRNAVGEAVKQASREQVTATVKRGGMVKPYADLLVELTHGSGLAKTLLEQIADGVSPAELYAAVLADDPNPILLVDPMKTSKVARAHKVLAALRASGRLREIELCLLDDMPLIKLKVNGEYQPSAQLSTGQRVTAILPFLLLPSVNPLVVDQIEDHLDNRFIFEVVVKTLLVAKAYRQFVLATHSANLSVLGESERTFELGVREAMGVIAAMGDAKEMSERSEACLEGGREPFLLRGQRYGHGGPKGEGGEK